MKDSKEIVDAFLGLTKEAQAAAFKRLAEQVEVYIVTAYDRDEGIIEPRVRFDRADADRLFESLVNRCTEEGTSCHIVMELGGEAHDQDMRNGRYEYLQEFEQ